MIRPFALPLIAAVTLALAGCAPQPVQVGALPYPPPPPLRAETLPKPPVSEEPLIWRPGHWDWTGGSYVWTTGEWTSRAGHGSTWQDGFWSNANGVWQWVPAHWI